MREYIRIDKVEHIWCNSNDRWVYIEYNDNDDIVGLNFMQGDEYHYFKKENCERDEALTKFYTEMLYTFPNMIVNTNSELSFINKCMWAYHSAISLNQKYS
jgi:hypothetical protein